MRHDFPTLTSAAEGAFRSGTRESSDCWEDGSLATSATGQLAKGALRSGTRESADCWEDGSPATSATGQLRTRNVRSIPPAASTLQGRCGSGSLTLSLLLLTA